jgi:predicted nucleic acid-binding protein
MTIVYFDSSAFVKLLIEEDGSDLAAALWNGCDAAVSSRLAYPEVRAALAAAGRAGRLAEKERSHAESLWEDFWAATRPVEFTEAVAAHAGELASRHRLRGADAVHLASLLAVGSIETVFAGWDDRLRAGAAAAGVRTAATSWS